MIYCPDPYCRGAIADEQGKLENDKLVCPWCTSVSVLDAKLNPKLFGFDEWLDLIQNNPDLCRRIEIRQAQIRTVNKVKRKKPDESNLAPPTP